MINVGISKSVVRNIIATDMVLLKNNADSKKEIKVKKNPKTNAR
jgi:hypothetical protein